MDARRHILDTLDGSYNGKVRTGGFELLDGPNEEIRAALVALLEEGTVVEQYDGFGPYYARGES